VWELHHLFSIESAVAELGNEAPGSSVEYGHVRTMQHDRRLQPAGVQQLLLCMTRSDRDLQLETENSIVPEHDEAAVGTGLLLGQF